MPEREITVSEDTARALRARSTSDETLDETIARLLERSSSPGRTGDAIESGDAIDIEEAVECVSFELETAEDES